MASSQQAPLLPAGQEPFPSAARPLHARKGEHSVQRYSQRPVPAPAPLPFLYYSITALPGAKVQHPPESQRSEA